MNADDNSWRTMCLPEVLWVQVGAFMRRGGRKRKSALVRVAPLSFSFMGSCYSCVYTQELVDGQWGKGGLAAEGWIHAPGTPEDARKRLAECAGWVSPPRYSPIYLGHRSGKYLSKHVPAEAMSVANERKYAFGTDSFGKFLECVRRGSGCPFAVRDYEKIEKDYLEIVGGRIGLCRLPKQETGIPKRVICVDEVGGLVLGEGYSGVFTVDGMFETDDGVSVRATAVEPV